MQPLTVENIRTTLAHYDGLIRQALEAGDVIEVLTKHDETLVSHTNISHSIADKEKRR